MSAAAALLAATALHAGFQLSVTLLVYPALRDVDPARFARAHALHSRRIVLLVGLVYGAVAAACVAVLVADRTPATLAACVLSAAAALLTALVAAPTHGRLGRDGPRPSLLTQLLRVDRLRTLAAVGSMVAALVAAGGAG